MFRKPFNFLPVFYLITWVMKASNFFGKIAILKIWELIFLGDVKTHFGKLALKWCIFRHEKKILLQEVHIVLSAKKVTRLYSKILLEKSSGNNFIFLPVFYLTICLMKTSKYFEKMVILKIWELVSLGGAKTHFGKIALKWCIFRHEKKSFWHSFWFN